MVLTRTAFGVVSAPGLSLRILAADIEAIIKFNISPKTMLIFENNISTTLFT